MKINLIGKNFEKESGQGVYRLSNELYENVRNKHDTTINEDGNVNIVMQPEQIVNAIFKKNVVTIVPDIIPLVYGERKLLYRLYFYFMMWLTVIKSKHLIAISDSTKRDINKWFPFTKKRTTVMPLWAKDNFYRIDQKSCYKEPLKIGYVGGLGKRKNVEFLLMLAMIGSEHLYYIAGTGPKQKELKQFKKDKDLTNVKFLGFVPDNKLNKFYNSLDILIFPSKYEGFGLPVLESMKSGTPVLVFNNSSVKEIVPNEKYIMENEDYFELLGIIKNFNLKQMSDECVKRAEKFDINESVNKLLEVCKNISK